MATKDENSAQLLTFYNTAPFFQQNISEKGG